MQYMSRFARNAKQLALSLLLGVTLANYAACGGEAMPTATPTVAPPFAAQAWQNRVVSAYTNRISPTCKLVDAGEVYTKPLGVGRYLMIDIYDAPSKAAVGRAVLNNLGNGRVGVVLYATRIVSSTENVSEKPFDGSVFVEDGNLVYRAGIKIDAGIGDLKVTVTDAMCEAQPI